MHPINVEELSSVQLGSLELNELFSKARSLTAPFGLSKLEIYHETLSPGHRASRSHFHTRKEEIVFVLQGTLHLVYGDASHILKAGDYAGFKPGDKIPHTLTNNSASPAVYLLISTNDPLDEVVYG
jgi:uncharacterized cupin superfamily protein